MGLKPEDLRYCPSHEWVSVSDVDGEKIGTIGISAFAVEQLTDLVFMALPKKGAKLTAGSEFGEVESVKAVSPLYSPVSGEVIEVHEELVDRLETLGDDPYDNGWILKVRMSDGKELDRLLDFAAYQKQCSQTH